MEFLDCGVMVMFGLSMLGAGGRGWARAWTCTEARDMESRRL